MCNCKVQGSLWILPQGTFWASVGKWVTDSPGPSSQLCLLHHIRVKLQEDTGLFQAWLTAKPRLSPQRAPSFSPDTPYPNPAFTLTSTAPLPVLSLLECPCFFSQDRLQLPSLLRSFPSGSLTPADHRLLCVPPAPWTCGSRLSLQPLEPVGLGWRPLYTLSLRFTALLSS